MVQGVQSPSMSGKASEYDLGGTAIYTDALFNNHLIGPFSSQGMPDTSKTLVPTLHDFTYDVYFYGTNLELSQAVEFDINQFYNSLGFIWGHEGRLAGGNEWASWGDHKTPGKPHGNALHPIDRPRNHMTVKVHT